jgi:acid phosphatase (class A)
MKRLFLFPAALLLFAASAFAQAPDQPKAAKAAKAAYYVDTRVLDLSLIVPTPPAQDSLAVQAELAELHRIEAARTPAQAAAAQADENDETIFAYASALGPHFSAAGLPLTAAFGAHVHGEEPANANPLKSAFHRARPYQVDSTLHPVCKTTDQPNSYPSGHTVSGYLLAFTLVQMVPEKKAEILARADEYAHNRLVCGVHYPSDIAASRNIANALFGYMMATPRFQIDLAAARAETRRQLGLN